MPTVIEQLTRLEHWVTARLSDELARPPLDEHVATLRQIIDQDSSRSRRQWSHAHPPRRCRGPARFDRGQGHATRPQDQSKRFNGYKRHLAIDLDTLLVLAVAVLPANRPEEAAPRLATDIAAQELTIGTLYIDRGYINAPIVDEILARRGAVVCRPWLAHNGSLFAKSAFKLNMRDRTITRPAGEQQPIVPGPRSNSLQRPAARARFERSAPMPHPSGAALWRSPTTNCSSIDCASKRRPPQADSSSVSAFQSSIARHTRAAAKGNTHGTSAIERTNSISDEPVPSATSRSFNASSRPQPRPIWPGPHDRDGFNPVGARHIITA